MIRTYLRRSKNDDGKQQFSLDVQREGCRKFVRQRLELADVEIVEYMDDGKAGDDFHSRVGMRRLFLDALPGDIIVCRDAIEVTLAIRDLVRDRGCRLYYYVTGQQVQFANAIDQATTFIQGTGHQMELEAIRSRTREALRSRVRDGRVAGGRCYGYDLERKADQTGRGYTVAVVNEAHAAVIRRIYDDYLAGSGLKAIARALNRESVPCPTVGRRGSGSWNPGGIRPMLMNPRYRGVYMHGRMKLLRRAGKTIRQKADPSEVITVELPEWRIVDDSTWFAVAELFDKRTGERKEKIAAGKPAPRSKRPAAKYPLSGIATCGVCGGAVGVAYAEKKGERVKAYACVRRHQRGTKVCSATTVQPMDEVEDLIIDYLRNNVATERVMGLVLAELENEITRQMPSPEIDIAALEAELDTTRAEQKRLAKATRERRVEITQSSEVKVTEGEEERTKRTIRNINKCHTLNYNYFQLLRKYETRLELYDVKLRYSSGVPFFSDEESAWRYDAQEVPISQAPSLVRDVVTEGMVDEVLAAIVETLGPGADGDNGLDILRSGATPERIALNGNSDFHYFWGMNPSSQLPYSDPGYRK